MRQRSHFRNRRCLAKCRRRLGRAFALKPTEKASSSRSQSAAAVPDIDAPSRTVRPPFRLFDPFSARLGTRLWLGYPLGLSASALKAKLFGGYPSVSTRRLIKGSRSYLRRHGVQSRGAAISYHKLTLSVYRKFCRARKAWRRTREEFAAARPFASALFRLAAHAAKIICSRCGRRSRAGRSARSAPLAGRRASRRTASCGECRPSPRESQIGRAHV